MASKKVGEVDLMERFVLWRPLSWVVWIGLAATALGQEPTMAPPEPAKAPAQQASSAPTEACQGICDPCRQGWMGSDAASQTGQPGTVGSPGAADLAATGGLAAGVGAGLPTLQGDVGYVCGTLSIAGQNASVTHPTWGCSRLNLAENGTPLPQDRLFFDYRHFQNVVKTDVFSVAGVSNNERLLNVDRFVFGGERTFANGLMSVELRVPFNYQINDTLELGRISNVDYGIPITSENFQLGNVGLVWKTLLRQTDYWTLSGGVGVKLPTAPDVMIRSRISNSDIPAYDVDGTFLGNLHVDLLEVAAMVANDSVDLIPFFGVTYAPNDRFFAQGLLQINTPLNGTRGVLGVHGAIGGADLNIADDKELAWQTLLRVNAQFGYWLYRNPSARINAVAGILEVNYTGTLTAADSAKFRLLDAVPPLSDNLDLTIGNEKGSTHLVNIGPSMAFLAGRTEIAPGFILPLNGGDEKPFDWEFDLRINRRF